VLIYDIYSIVYEGASANMKIEKDIGIWEGILNESECQQIVDHFNKLDQLNLSYTRRTIKDGLAHHKSDTGVYVLDEKSLRFGPGAGFLGFFMERFWNCWTEYIDHYSVMHEAGKHTIRSMKIQKTLPGEGYHQWHFESDAIERSSRICAWAVYLNTVELGGETEWLYQSVRIPATQGTLTIWPAGFTHTHRGNPPISGEKYLITGWVEF